MREIIQLAMLEEKKLRCKKIQKKECCVVLSVDIRRSILSQHKEALATGGTAEACLDSWFLLLKFFITFS